METLSLLPATNLFLHFTKGLIEVVLHQTVIMVRTVDRAFAGGIGTAWSVAVVDVGKDIQQGGARRERKYS